MDIKSQKILLVTIYNHLILLKPVGGVAIYTKQLLNCKIAKLDLDSLCDQKQFEVTGITINSQKLIVSINVQTAKGKH